MTTTQNTKKEYWQRENSRTGEPPKIGERRNIMVEGDNEMTLTGAIVEVGGHWSEQSRGMSGWWVKIEIEVPDNVIDLTEFGGGFCER